MFEKSDEVGHSLNKKNISRPSGDAEVQKNSHKAAVKSKKVKQESHAEGEAVKGLFSVAAVSSSVLILDMSAISTLFDYLAVSFK